MRRCVGILLLAAALLVSAGCENTLPKRPPRQKNYTSVVSLSPGTTEILFSYGSDTKVIKGRTQADNYPVNLVGPVEVVASVKPDYEKLAAIKPDLVVYDAALYSQQDLDKVKSTTNADMFAISANSIDEYVKQLYELGSLIASESRINDYVSKIYAERQAATATPYEPPPKVAVIMPGQGGSDYVAGTKGFVASAVQAGGGEAVGPDSTIFEPMNAEAIVGLNPDVIVVPGTKDNAKAALAVLNNPRYKTLNAVKNQRVRIIDQDVLLRRGGRVDLLIKGLHAAFGPTRAQ